MTIIDRNEGYLWLVTVHGGEEEEEEEEERSDVDTKTSEAVYYSTSTSRQARGEEARLTFLP